ncbi:MULTISPECIES: energy transducer TonB [Flavobacterium]|uniref:energy transducer TonB n=1 Tax=Flavobacterium TaxID=237 RepID=UPI0011825724|nr:MULTISPECIES: energy transducer TonB [Flavobacterium]MCR4031028.1 energy transducer TonB [Flavobacterium panacis]
MSKLNIYENKWNDLVFENRNKEYGAYQLRQENPRTTVNALFMGLLLITALGSIPVLISKFKPQTVEPVTEVPTFDDEHIVTPYNPTVTPPPPAPPAPVVEQTAATKTESTQLVNPVITTAENAVEKIAVNTDNAPVVESVQGTGTPNGSTTAPGGGGNGSVVSAVPSTGEPVSTAILDKLPEYPGGIGEFYKYVGNNFRRPELDMEKTLRVYLSFVVEKDGSITDIIVLNDPGYGMGKEAIRVLKSVKAKWSPGILDGKAVRTAYKLPITIKTEVE